VFDTAKQTTLHMKTRMFIGLLLAISTLPFRSGAAGGSGVTYDVDWPAIHLDGTFTLEVGSGFGTYFSSSALGTYGGTSGSYNTVWTGVELNAQSNFAELTFTWDQGYTGYAVSPSYVGRSSPWTSASDAWNDLITKGASDGVLITIVPEPSPVLILGSGLLSLTLLRSRTLTGAR